MKGMRGVYGGLPRGVGARYGEWGGWGEWGNSGPLRLCIPRRWERRSRRWSSLPNKKTPGVKRGHSSPVWALLGYSADYFRTM